MMTIDTRRIAEQVVDELNRLGYELTPEEAEQVEHDVIDQIADLFERRRIASFVAFRARPVIRSAARSIRRAGLSIASRTDATRPHG